jgi:hypothetical protein
VPEKKSDDTSGKEYEQEIAALFELEEPCEKKTPEPSPVRSE